MSRRLGVVESADLRAVSPAAAWIVVGDLVRLPEWTSAIAVEGAPLDPAVEDEFAAIHRAGPFRYRVAYEVASWDAGRRFRLGAAGWPLTDDGELRVAVESMVEPEGAWSRVELVAAGSVPAWAWPLATPLVRRGLRRWLRRLERLLA